MNKKTFWSELLFYAFVFSAILILINAFTDNGEVENKEKVVCVHIKGEVVAPGYYELEVGSRVKDALIVAGGETNDADLSALNIARILVDGEEILVPKTGSLDSEGSKLININTADMYQLCKLDGIGESLATAIINYRVENEGFKTIEEIKNVKGIGDAKFDKIKSEITVE